MARPTQCDGHGQTERTLAPLGERQGVAIEELGDLLLEHLMGGAGRMCSRSCSCDAVWGGAVGCGWSVVGRRDRRIVVCMLAYGGWQVHPAHLVLRLVLAVLVGARHLAEDLADAAERPGQRRRGR